MSINQSSIPHILIYPFSTPPRLLLFHLLLPSSALRLLQSCRHRPFSAHHCWTESRRLWPPLLFRLQQLPLVLSLCHRPKCQTHSPAWGPLGRSNAGKCRSKHVCRVLSASHSRDIYNIPDQENDVVTEAAQPIESRHFDHKSEEIILETINPLL